MIPPSTVFAVYGLITEQDVGKLFVAGVLPGMLAVCMYMIDHHDHRLRCDPAFCRGHARNLGGALAALREVWAHAAAVRLRHRRASTAVCSRATEAAGMGAGGAFLIGVVRGRLSRPDIRALAAGCDAHHSGGIHRADRRAAVRLLPDRHADAAESDACS